jgi:hypothetical protein
MRWFDPSLGYRGRSYGPTEIHNLRKMGATPMPATTSPRTPAKGMYREALEVSILSVINGDGGGRAASDGSAPGFYPGERLTGRGTTE